MCQFGDLEMKIQFNLKESLHWHISKFSNLQINILPTHKTSPATNTYSPSPAVL